jgi:hypothetical protein
VDIKSPEAEFVAVTINGKLAAQRIAQHYLAILHGDDVGCGSSLPDGVQGWKQKQQDETIPKPHETHPL